jgi:hypothetical protein
MVVQISILLAPLIKKGATLFTTSPPPARLQPTTYLAASTLRRHRLRAATNSIFKREHGWYSADYADSSR